MELKNTFKIPNNYPLNHNHSINAAVLLIIICIVNFQGSAIEPVGLLVDHLENGDVFCFNLLYGL